MTEYTLRDSVLGLRREQEKLRECWEDGIAERYQGVMANYESRLTELDRMLGNVSGEMEKLRNFCRRMEDEEAGMSLRGYRKTLY